MNAKEKVEELVNVYVAEFFKPIYHIHYFDNLKLAKQCALIAVDRNIKMFTDLVNSMDDFSNESRQVIFQLIENEQQVKQQINEL